jgi:hypothetical protein
MNRYQWNIRNLVKILAITFVFVSVKSECNKPGCLSCNSQGVCVLCDGSTNYVLDKSVCIYKPVENCDYVIGVNECGVCKNGFYLGRDAKCYSLLSKRIRFCAVYVSSVTCQWCEKDYYINSSGECAPVKVSIPSCKYYKDSTNCSICESGYALNPVDYTCSQLSPLNNCMLYNYPQSCKSCIQNYSYNPNFIMTKINNFYSLFALKKRLIESGLADAIFHTPYCERNSGFGFCVEYQTGNVCKKCAYGYYLQKSGVCEQNPVSFLTQRDEVVLHCFSFNSQNICQLCLDMFYIQISDNTCLPHSARVENCFKMSQFIKDLCLICKPGYVKSAGIDSPMGSVCNKRLNKIAYCEQYGIQVDVCISCHTGFILHNSGMKCSRAIQNCLNYDINSISLSCISCYENYALISNLCQIADTNCSYVLNGVCNKCDNGYILSSNKNCQAANPTAINRFCIEYSAWSLGSPIKCNTCPENSIKTTQKTVCTTTGFIDGCLNFDKNGVCIQCNIYRHFDLSGSCVLDKNDSCMLYNKSTTNCIKCKTGYYLNNLFACVPMTPVSTFVPVGKCLALNSSNNYDCKYCEPGYFVRLVNDSSVTFSCKATTNTNCLIINEKSGKCELCKNGFYKDITTTSNTCVSSCPAERVKNPITNSCELKEGLITKESTFSDCSLAHGYQCFQCATKIPLYDFRFSFSFQSITRARVAVASGFTWTNFVGISKCSDATTTETQKYTNYRGNTIDVVFGQTFYYNFNTLTKVYSNPITSTISSCTIAANNLVFPDKFIHYKYILSCYQCGSSKAVTITRTNFSLTIVTNSDYTVVTPATDTLNTLPEIVCTTNLAVDFCQVQEYDPNTETVNCILCAPKYKPVYSNGIITSCAAITNCLSSNRYSECEICMSGFAAGYNSLTSSPDYTICINVTGNLNCKVFSTELSTCIECNNDQVPINGVCALNTSLVGNCNSSFGTSQCVLCTSASQAVSYNTDVTTVNQCARLYLLDAANKLKNCGFYQVDANNIYTCLFCSPNYILFQSSCKPRSSISNCISFDTTRGALTCIICQTGYTLVGNTCTKVTGDPNSINGCEILLKSYSCAVCKSGYYLVSEFDSTRSDSVNFCVLATIPIRCSRINKLEFANEKNIYCEMCLPGTKPSLIAVGSQDNFCIRFETISNCKTQLRNTCVECEQKYFLQNNVCVLRTSQPSSCVKYLIGADSCDLQLPSVAQNNKMIPLIYPQNLNLLSNLDISILNQLPPERPTVGTGIYKCIEYNMDVFCVKCEEQFYLDSGNKCIRSSVGIPNCQSYKNSTSCLECKSGYIIDGTVCTPIKATNCLEYSNSKTCKSCLPTFPILDSTKLICIKPKDDPFCEHFGQGADNSWKCQICADFYFPNDSGICSLISIPIPNCIKYVNASTCMKCELGYYWDLKVKVCTLIYDFEPNCADLTGITECSFCQLGYYLEAGSCKQCQTDSSCAVCNYKLPSQCLVCADGYYMQANNNCAK